MQRALMLGVVLLASFGLFSQCVANAKAKRAPFLAFPIALFLLMPYSLWGGVAVQRNDLVLLVTMLLLGVPSAWLSAQYFQYEWPLRGARGFAAEERVALLLLLIGLGVLVSVATTSGLAVALTSSAAFFTACLVVYSFLVKIWRVSRGEQSLDGVKWVALIALALLYGSMVLYGQSQGMLLLKLAYSFAEACVLAAIAYKAYLAATARIAREDGEAR